MRIGEVIERQGRAMGSTTHIVVAAPAHKADRLVCWAVERIDEFEQRWSRFLDTSEVSKLNHEPGQPHQVSSDTVTLVSRAIEARELSGGAFDPTMLQAMHANGYDRTFVAIRQPTGLAALDTRAIGLGAVAVDAASNTVTLGPTTGFDPGGIGKGLAADIVAEELLDRGADGAMVNIGGDVRCAGQAPDGAWLISAGDVVAGVDNRVIELAQGGIASSTCRRRTWTRQVDGERCNAHHLLDPATGQSKANAADLVTVIAASCADAEWLATAIAAKGELPSDPSVLGGASVLFTDHHGETHTAGDVDWFMR